MTSTKHPTIWTGALTGVLLTATAMSIFFLADRVAGLPFVPFDLFDLIGKRLPGGVLTSAIDAMVKTIRTFNLGETSSAAKSIEQLIGLVTFLAAGLVAGIAFFAIVPRLKGQWERLGQGNTPGLIMGGIVGVIMIAISSLVNVTATADPLLGAVWILAVFLVWGAAFSRIYYDLSALPEKGKTGEAPVASVTVLNRRQFMVRVGGATATLTVIGAGLGALLGPKGPEETRIASGAVNPSAETDGVGDKLPNADDPLQPAPGTRPEYTPLADHYRIDINARPPVVNGETWKLPITGMVENSMELTLNDIRNNYEPTHQYITLACISNPVAGDLIGTTRWTGVSLKKILEQLKPTGTHLRITSADGFDEVLDLQIANDDERVMLAYEWDGQPLLEEHGFPLRIYIPDRYGMKQPKWIANMEVIGQWEEGYWVRRGWSKDAIMNTTSVIDTVAADSLIQDGNKLLVPIGGIAHAGARGISKVEVKVNDGDWVEAKLRSPLSQTTWVIWRYDWPFEEGSHQFEVRAYEGDGTPQIETVRDVRPDGATGIHSIIRNLQKPAGSA